MTSVNQTASVPPCAACGGPQVANLRLVEKSGVGLHPAGRSFWRPMAGLSATVCLDCGQVGLAVRDLPKFRQETEKHPDWFVW